MIARPAKREVFYLNYANIKTLLKLLRFLIKFVSTAEVPLRQVPCQSRFFMRIFRYILFSILTVNSLVSAGQVDSIRPAPPVLSLVTVNRITGNVEISWLASTSPDISGYVVYLYRNNEGYVLDTLHNPLPTSYIRTGSGASFYSESFVVAALDTAGNISPLSNALNTIYTEAEIDTCNTRLGITWNSYPSDPVRVMDYSVFYSVGGGSFSEAARTAPDKTSLLIDDFDTDVQYCFFVRANLENGQLSGSNTACLLTRMQRPPQWINADYATVGDNDKIELSFKIDPLSGITSYRLERKTGASDIFRQIHQFSSNAGSLLYTDNEADISKINYYRLAAVNNCGTPVIYSNIASNIVLSLNRDKDDIELRWNPYLDWTGSIGSYRLFVNTGGQYEEKEVIPPEDTIFITRYSDIMYEVTGTEVCFMVKAYEASNPYGEAGESRSSAVCIPVTENVTVPDTFTPDGNLINDYFRPVLSFTPVGYHLVITNLRRKILFETRNHTEEWYGSYNGSRLPEGVYLWFLKVRAPSGNSISKTGTVTIINNR